MATNNAINDNDAGLVTYDGAGTFGALAIPLIVANGGTGVSSTTAYAVQCGGTTSTSPVQSIASVGTDRHALTSNGAGTLPSFQNFNRIESAYFTWTSTGTYNPVDGNTAYMALGGAISGSSGGVTRVYTMPSAITIKAAYGVVNIAGTLGSSQNVSVYIRVNNTTDTAITTTSQWTANPTTFSNTGLSLALSAGDFIVIKLVFPTWTTNPTSISMAVQLFGY